MRFACQTRAMSNVQVKNLDEELHQQLRARAAQEGTTISDYVLELIRRDLRKPTRRQWLDEVAQLPKHNIPREAIYAAIDEGRNRR